MGSAYTDNNKFEKIGTGEQAGTWGTTTNLNFDMIDRAINGVKTITLTGSSSSLTTSDGALTDGLFKVLQFAGTLSSLHTITISPNDVEKLYFINNNCGASVKFTQGSGGDVTIENAKTAIIFCDGAGGSAKVTKIETGSESFTEDLTVKTGDGALLTLQTSDTTVTDGDVLGALQFQAPDDTDGKTGDADGSKVAASIVAEADNTFAADNNQTDMVFKLGGTSAATEKMRLTHEGDLEFKVDGFDLLFGADGDVNLKHVADTGLLLASTRQLQFGDSGTYIHQSADGVLDLVSDTEIEINATTIDINGAVVCDSVITATGFTIGSAAITEAELEYLDQVTPGTVAVSHAVVVDSNKDIDGFRNITATGTIQGAEVTATSDERLKSDIKTIDNALEKVMNMRGVSFTKQAEKGIGVIAQEVEKIIPEVVHDGEYKSVAYGNMVGVLIEAIKEQQKQIDELKKDK
jgi:hypothetical protein